MQRHLGTLLLLENPGLRYLALGDVRNRALIGDDDAIVVINGTRVFKHHDLAAVLTPQTVLEVLDQSLGFQAGEYPLPVDRVYVERGSAAGLLEVLYGVVAKHFDQRRIGGNDFAFPGGDIDALDDILKQPAIARLAALESLIVDLLLDRDAGKPGHALELVQFIRRWLARLVNVNIQRTDNA